MFKSIGGFFKSVFTDLLPPVVLGIAGGPVAGPFLAFTPIWISKCSAHRLRECLFISIIIFNNGADL